MLTKTDDYGIKKYRSELMKDPIKRMVLGELDRKNYVPID
jgi:hypothetical protein